MLAAKAKAVAEWPDTKERLSIEKDGPPQSHESGGVFSAGRARCVKIFTKPVAPPAIKVALKAVSAGSETSGWWLIFPTAYTTKDPPITIKGSPKGSPTYLAIASLAGLWLFWLHCCTSSSMVNESAVSETAPAAIAQSFPFHLAGLSKMRLVSLKVSTGSSQMPLAAAFEADWQRAVCTIAKRRITVSKKPFLV